MKISILLILPIIFTQCKSQTFNTNNMDTIVTSDFKTFNFKKIDDLRNISLKENSIETFRKDSTIELQFSRKYKYDELLEYNQKGSIIKKTIIKEDNTVEIYQPISPFLNYYERYYPNGNITVKAINSWLGFGIGMQYNFSKEGKLIKEKDRDKGYNFTFDDVLQFCERNDIDLLSKCGFPHRVVKIEEDKKYWIIEYCNSKTGKIEGYKLDASSGEIVLKTIENFPRIEHLSADKEK